MYRIIGGDSRDLPDANRFIDVLNHSYHVPRDFFGGSSDILISRAPGRLDVMGGIADYSGSLVLEMPIAEATLAAVQKSTDSTIKILSLSGDAGSTQAFEMPLSDLENDDYTAVRTQFSQDSSSRWASYVAGVFFSLKRERGIDFQNGAHILITSQIPVGKGVSSSAALEVSAMQAICSAYDITIEPRELALLCQKVENEIVGAACGVMDQLTVHCGAENCLLPLLCQPAEIGEPLKVPDQIEFWGIDSGVRHAVAGSDYTSVRIGAFIGYRMIADLAGSVVERIGDGLVRVNDLRWSGYLANVSPLEYEREFMNDIPEFINGGDFLREYGGTTDTVTTIDPARTYMVKTATEHPIYENFRVRTFSDLLKNAFDESTLDTLGELMFQSHSSYAACGLTEPGTDRIVEIVRENHDRGLFGARITGGGSGGTVAILARRGSGAVITKVAAQYEKETGRTPYIFHGSSPGCSRFGSLRLSLTK